MNTIKALFCWAFGHKWGEWQDRKATNFSLFLGDEIRSCLRCGRHDVGFKHFRIGVDHAELRLDEHYRCCIGCCENPCERAKALLQEIFNLKNHQ